MNYVSLFMIMELGTPNQWMMSVKNKMTCLDLILVMGQTSIHLENLSIATNKWVKRLGAFCRGPMWSRPHTTKGQVMGIVCRACAKRWIYRT